MRCRKSNGVLTTVRWRYFMAQCPKINQLCSGVSGGYVSAITVCQLSLF
jgi:phage FluMu protein Com